MTTPDGTPSKSGTNLRLMAHLVVGYPDLATSFRTAEAYVRAGVRILELQLPFSHPTADGPTITRANQVAVSQGITMAEALQQVAQLRARFPAQQMVVMTYLNKAYQYGLARLCAFLAAHGVNDLILPDLPFDAPLATVIHNHPEVHLMPVVAGNISAERFEKLRAIAPKRVYVMAGFRLTGEAFALPEQTLRLVRCLKAELQTEVGIGFGISSANEFRQVLAAADFAIVGSALIKAQQSGQLKDLLHAFAAETH